MKQKFDSVEEYISSFPLNTQKILKNVRTLIKQRAPAAIELISYGMPGYKLNGKPLIYFAGFNKHLGIYPIPSGIAAFKTELEGYVSGKGSVQFPLDRQIPYELIGRIVDFRVSELNLQSKK